MAGKKKTKKKKNQKKKKIEKNIQDKELEVKTKRFYQEQSLSHRKNV